MMSCLRTALKEWMKHVKKSASLMTHCALNSTRNSWRNMLNKMSCYGIVFQQFVKILSFSKFHMYFFLKYGLCVLPFSSCSVIEMYQ